MNRAAPNWLHLGDDIPYHVAETLRREQIRVMAGVEVRTRNNHYTDGKRLCSVYLRRKDDQ